MRRRAEKEGPAGGDVVPLLTNFIVVLKDFVSLFRERHHEAILGEVLGIKIWTAAPVRLHGALAAVPGTQQGPMHLSGGRGSECRARGQRPRRLRTCVRVCAERARGVAGPGEHARGGQRLLHPDVLAASGGLAGAAAGAAGARRPARRRRRRRVAARAGAARGAGRHHWHAHQGERRTLLGVVWWWECRAPSPARSSTGGWQVCRHQRASAGCGTSPCSTGVRMYMQRWWALVLGCERRNPPELLPPRLRGGDLTSRPRGPSSWRPQVLGLVPTAPVSLMQLVGSHMPHKLRDRNSQCLYFQVCAHASPAA